MEIWDDRKTVEHNYKCHETMKCSRNFFSPISFCPVEMLFKNEISAENPHNLHLNWHKIISPVSANDFSFNKVECVCNLRENLVTIHFKLLYVRGICSKLLRQIRAPCNMDTIQWQPLLWCGIALDCAWAEVSQIQFSVERQSKGGGAKPSLLVS